MSDEMRILSRNAKVELEVEVEKLRHFRPGRGEKDREAAIIHLSPVDNSPYAAKIYDEREVSVLISRGLANIRTAERAGKKYLDLPKIEAAKKEARENWPEFLGLTASVYLDFEEASTHRRYPVLILRDPEESEKEGLLTATTFDTDPQASFGVRDHHGSWYRKVLVRDEDSKTNHFLILSVTSADSPISVYHRHLDGTELIATDYILTSERRVIRREATISKVEWLEGEPFPEAVASFEEGALTGPEEPEEVQSAADAGNAEAEENAKPGKNGKVAVVCPECGKKARISPKRIGKTHCNDCNELLIPATKES